MPVRDGSREPLGQDFAQNLRLLTDHYPSVAEVCRKIGVNRSQYNKYLSGKSAPSRHMLRTICDFFGVEAEEIRLPHARFQEILGGAGPSFAKGAARRPYLRILDQLAERSGADLTDYEGFYFEHSHSMTYPALILRALIHLTCAGGVPQYTRIENMARAGERRYSVRNKYKGLAFYLRDRIFLIDYESVSGIEISQTVLFPNYKSRLVSLSGLKLGVSSSNRREPLCARVVWQALGRRTDVKSALRRCGLFEPDDAGIDPDIKAAIDNRMEDGASHFRVVSE